MRYVMNRFLPLLFPLLTLPLAAQKPRLSDTWIGFHGSGGICRVDFNPRVSQNLKTITSAGLILRHVSEPHIGVQLEFNYTEKGWVENRDSLGIYTRTRQNLDIPVLAAFVAGNKKVRAVVTLGPYISFRLKDTDKIELTDSRYAYVYYGQALDDKMEFGFSGGVALEWYSPIGVFGLRATYANSLTNVFLLDSDTFIYSASRFQLVTAGISYFIKL
jgi:hypothetical protein